MITTLNPTLFDCNNRKSQTELFFTDLLEVEAMMKRNWCWSFTWMYMLFIAQHESVSNIVTKEFVCTDCIGITQFCAVSMNLWKMASLLHDSFSVLFYHILIHSHPFPWHFITHTAATPKQILADDIFLVNEKSTCVVSQKV